MARSTAALERRIHQLATRMGCCPQHGERLHCLCGYEYRWTGTDAELKELDMLVERRSVSYAPLFAHEDCERCQSPRWCETCSMEQVQRLEGPSDLLTLAEATRYGELCAMLQVTPSPADADWWQHPYRPQARGAPVGNDNGERLVPRGGP
jgi:hypothetical protein